MNPDDIQYPQNLHTSPEFGNQCVRFSIIVQSNSQLYSKERSAAPLVEIGQGDPSFGEGNTQWKQTKASQSGPKRRLAQMIALYVPNDMSQSQQVTWSEEDMSTNIISNIDEVIGAATKNISGKNSISENAVNMTIDTFSSIGGMAGSVLLKMPGMSGAQSALQLTPGNAKTEQLFQGVDFRSFNFNYQFNPKNEEEAKNVMKIISLFRHHMLPEFFDKTSQYLFIYPSQFEIKYYVNENGVEKEHPYLDRHFTQVLTNCNVNYTPMGQHITFQNGMPAHINLSLTFKELAIHTKDQMKVWA